MFDDAVLHPDLPLLIWCMGTNDMEYSQEMLESVLQIAADCSDSQFRDASEKCEKDQFLQFEQGNTLTKCIMIRAFYRGMKCDVKNLRGFAHVWNQRFSDNQAEFLLDKVYKDTQPLQDIEFAEPYKFSDVTIEGIDSGCSGIVYELMKNSKVHEYLSTNNVTTNAEDFLISKLWEYRSGLNKRRYFSELIESRTLEEIKKSIDQENFQNLVLPAADAYSRKVLLKKFFF